jgi:outer membrane murein-binding lipoprotein Lpp
MARNTDVEIAPEPKVGTMRSMGSLTRYDLSHIRGSSLIVASVLVVGALLAGGCGSSSKPEYCSKVSDLRGSVEELKAVEIESGTLATLEADLKTVRSNAGEVVESAKQDFPNETSALKTSVSSLSAATEELAAAPTPQELLALAPKVSGVVLATEELTSATESACE